jgi:quercetin dioxygenase-like cupin family protein
MTETPFRTEKWNQKNPPSEDLIQQRLDAEGLTYYKWSNAPGDIYAAHTHPYHKIIYVLKGSITFGLPGLGEQVTLEAGDRLDLPPGTVHDALVGPEGVVCLEAHLTNR